MTALVETGGPWQRHVVDAVQRVYGIGAVIERTAPVWAPRVAATLGVYRAIGYVASDGTTKPIDAIVKCVARPVDGPAPEADFYASAAPADLPAGLASPRWFGTVDLDDRTTAIVLEHVRDRPAGDAADRIARIAHLLGRLAGSGESAFAAYAETRPRRRLLASVGAIGDLLDGIAALQPTDALRPAFPPDVIGRLDEVRAMSPALAADLDRLPALPCHGDANPRNFLVGDDRIVAIDWANAGMAPVGHDLAVLVYYAFALFDLDTGRFRELERRFLDAYIDGLRAEGCDVECDNIQRGGVAVLESTRTMQMVTGEIGRDSAEARYGAPLPAILARRSELLRLSLGTLHRQARDRFDPPPS